MDSVNFILEISMIYPYFYLESLIKEVPVLDFRPPSKLVQYPHHM